MPKRTDIIAGLTTFFTASYIVIVNPAILSTQGTGIAFSGALTATVLLAFSMTLLMGWYAKLPYVVAPGMGVNAFFVYSLILEKHIPWPVAFGMIFWAGVLFLLISLTNLRVAIARAIPHSLRCAAAAGIGLLLTFIGLKNAGIIVADPATLVRLGPLNSQTVVTVAGGMLMIFLFLRKNPLAFLAGIALITIVFFCCGWSKLPETIFAKPDFESVFFKLDIWTAVQLTFWPAIFTVMFTDLFDSISTFVGVSHATGLTTKDGEPQNLREGLIVDSFATFTAGLFGTSSGTAFIESAAGIEAGGRDGKSAMITAICFLPCFFLAPLLGAIPLMATAPVLVFIGCLMFRSIAEVSFDDLSDALPAFLTVVLIPFTMSITQGLLWGFTSYVAMQVACGHARKVSKMLWGIALASLALLVIEQ